MNLHTGFSTPSDTPHTPDLPRLGDPQVGGVRWV